MERGGRGRWKRTRSKVWEHFTRLIGDDGKKRSKCNRCRKQYTYGHGTSNMLEHLKECGSDQGHESAHVVRTEEQQPPPLPSLALEDEDIQQQQPPLVPPLALASEDEGIQQLPSIRPSPCAPSSSTGEQHPTPRPYALSDDGPSREEQVHHHGSGLDEEEEACRDLAQMIALRGHHSSIVEDTHFRSFVRCLNPRFKLPTREDIEKACDTLCDNIGMQYNPWQQITPGAVSLAVGKARSVEAGEAVYITCNFIDDEWNLHRMVDHAYLVLPPGDHYNASASTLLGVPVVSTEVVAERVVAYVLVHKYYYPLMIAGEMTGDIGQLELKRLMDQEDIKIFCTTNMDHVFHSVARSLLPNSDLAKDIFCNVLDLQWARQDRQRLLSELGLDDPLESSEQWYWCYCSLVIADHELLLTLDSQTLLCNLWGAIYSGIKRVSPSNTPTSNLCLEELLKVRGALQSQLSATSAAHLPLREALGIVDKAIEDSYQLWSVPLVLDPRYKMRHIEEQFQKAFDDSKASNYTSQVRRVVKELHSHTAAKAELNDYLEDSPARTTKGFDFDILNWWKVHGSVQYPTVARMARAALAIPTCSKLTSHQTAQVKSIIRGHKKSDW